MTLLDGGSSAPAAPGGDSSSSDGSSSTTGAGANESFGARVRAAREQKGWTRTRLDSEAKIGGGASKQIEEGHRTPSADVRARLEGLLELAPGEPVTRDAAGPPASSERRPSAEGKPRRRGLFERRAKVEAPDSPRSPRERPTSAGRRVSTSPLTESILTFAAGGMERIGQGPLGHFTAFTAPVAGEIVDDVVAGTVVDKLVQPLVRGSEKYQNLGALFAGYASIAWATNVPEAEPQAFALFQWSMTTLLPLQGKQMVKRAKDHEKAMAALEEIMPELIKLVPPQFATDPIRGLWAMMYAQPEPAPTPAEEPARA